MPFYPLIEYSKHEGLFAAAPLKHRREKRRSDSGCVFDWNEEKEANEETNGVYTKLTVRRDQESNELAFYKKEWGTLKVNLTHKAMRLLFYSKWRHDLSECQVKIKSWNECEMKINGKHAIEFMELISGLDELSNYIGYNIAFDMLYKKFATEFQTDLQKEAMFLLKFVYLVSFYKAGWRFGNDEGTELSDFFIAHEDQIHSIARQTLPNSHNAMELYMDVYDQQDECSAIFKMLTSINMVVQSKWPKSDGKKKRKYYPVELTQKIIQKLIEQTQVQQEIYMKSAVDNNKRRLPNPSISLLPLRALNFSFKRVVDSHIQKNCRIEKQVVAFSDCLTDNKLIYLPTKFPHRNQPTVAYCDRKTLQQVDHLLDPSSAKIYLYLHNQAYEVKEPGLVCSTTETCIHFSDNEKQDVYRVTMKRLQF